jgi:hypothetical protein
VLKSVSLLVCAASLFAAPAWADTPIRQAGNFGLGLGGGTGVAGISAKYFVADHHAFQGVVGGTTLGWGKYGGGGSFAVGLDYLVEMPAIAEAPEVELGWNLGAGGTIGFSSTTWIFVSGAIGLEANFMEVPIDLVIAWRPGVAIDSDGDGFLNLASARGHIRYYF